MEHKGTVELQTERLILRRFKGNDYADAFGNWTSDERVTKFLRWRAHKDISETAKIIGAWIESYKSDNFYQWAICMKNGADSPVGTISVVGQNEELGILHIGYCLGHKWWNKGIMSEAFAAVIAFLFDEVKANRIESQHDPENPYSGRVMQKCGLKYEGTLRQADMNNQGIVDAAMYSILRCEYDMMKNSKKLKKL